MEEERRAVVGYDESLGVWTSIEGWGVTMAEESRTCLQLAACGVGGFLEATWEYQIIVNTWTT